MTVKIKNLLLENSGQGLLEYSLIIFFIAVAVIVALQTFGKKVLELYEYIVA